MTAQRPERLHFEGRQVPLCTLPLERLFEVRGAKPEFAQRSTALMRGYVGTWEVQNGQLLLVSIDGFLEGGGKASLETVVASAKGPQFADWYSGRLRVTQGRRLRYVHMDFRSVYEYDILIDVEAGRVVHVETRQNGEAGEVGEPEPYKVAAPLELDVPDFLLHQCWAAHLSTVLSLRILGGCIVQFRE